ncbi:MAG: ABC transporter permease [Chitinophagaceae bacterium]|nr:ABC transporter permease [Chitinophagaceae bacterium]
MLKNYCKIAWRHLLKSKLYSSINILGLSLGMAVTLLIGLWVWDELSFNHYYRNHASLALMFDNQTWNGKTSTDKEVDIPLAEILKTEYPNEFKQVALISPSEPGHLLIAGDKNITTTGIYMQPQLPEMLTLHMLSGARDGLKDPSSVLITASVARALFGSSDAVGRQIRIDSNRQAKIAGVYEDLPRNTDLHFVKLILPWDTYESAHPWVQHAANRWGFHFGRMIVQLNPGVDIDRVNKKIKDLPKRYEKEGKEDIFLHPMDKVRLYNEFKDGKIAGGLIRYVWFFGIIGVFVLLLACINFMNLSTARSEQRVKEVGIRKTVGSLRGQLIAQFLCESLLLALSAFILAIFLVYISLPLFNAMLANKELKLPLDSPLFWILTTCFTLFTGVIAGSYPAFYLSGFPPLKVLKGTFRAGARGSLTRKVLVTVQFTISIALIIGTIIVYRQIQFAKDRPVGYVREGLITVNAEYSPEIMRHLDALKNELIKTGAVEKVATSDQPVTDVYIGETNFSWDGKDPNSHQLFRIMSISPGFGETIGWKIKEGRDFYKDYRTDTATLLVNQAAVALMGMKDPLGKVLANGPGRSRIVGVVNDLLTESPFSSSVPTVYWLTGGTYIHLRVNPNMSMQTALNRITPLFKKYSPQRPLDYRFVDEDYEFKFVVENRISRLATFFTIFAILISCLGLFGLASFVAEQRTKEIGIRKVLGASVFSLWRLLSREFVALVMLSFLIAAPIAWYYLDQWLQKYEYRAPISWWIFATAGILALVITLLTVSARSVRAALMNPVRSLKTE